MTFEINFAVRVTFFSPVIYFPGPANLSYFKVASDINISFTWASLGFTPTLVLFIIMPFDFNYMVSFMYEML